MNLRLNTIYNPLTYDELIRPLIDYGKAYKEVEDAYSTLAEQSESFKDEVNKEINSEAFTLYDKYSTDLNAAIEDFSRGMTIANRNKLLEMKRRYAGEITPIVKASEALKEANTFRDKAGPDAIFKVKRYTSLDDFLHGQIADNTYTSAKQLAAQANAEALTVGSKLYKEKYFGRDTPILNSLYDKLWNEAGGDSYDIEGQEQVHNAIMMGINSAMYSMEQQDKERGIQLANLDETRRVHNMDAQLKGYKVDSKGNLVKDPDSPVWSYSSNNKKDSITKIVPGRYKIMKGKVTPVEKLGNLSLTVVSYEDISDEDKNAIAELIGNSTTDNYIFYKDTVLGTDRIFMEAKVPRKMGEEEVPSYETDFNANG